MLPVLGESGLLPPIMEFSSFLQKKPSITGEHNVDPTPSPETWIRTPDPRLDEAQTNK
uniref:Uncharacterized protein n=1 Tax=Magallana gigas TaxID=29159 RepID=K1RFU5_MAGGI